MVFLRESQAAACRPNLAEPGPDRYWKFKGAGGKSGKPIRWNFGSAGIKNSAGFEIPAD